MPEKSSKHLHNMVICKGWKVLVREKQELACTGRCALSSKELEMTEWAFHMDLLSCWACLHDLHHQNIEEPHKRIRKLYSYEKIQIQKEKDMWKGFPKDVRISELDIRLVYLEEAIFREKTDRTSFDDESVANNLANASKVEVSGGTSRQSEL